MKRRSLLSGLAALPAAAALPQIVAAAPPPPAFSVAELVENVALPGYGRLWRPSVPFVHSWVEDAAERQRRYAEDMKKFEEDTKSYERKMEEAWNSYVGLRGFSLQLPGYGFEDEEFDDLDHPDFVALRSIFEGTEEWRREDVDIYDSENEWTPAIVHRPSGVVIFLGETWVRIVKVIPETSSVQVIVTGSLEYVGMEGDSAIRVVRPDLLPLA